MTRFRLGCSEELAPDAFELDAFESVVDPMTHRLSLRSRFPAEKTLVAKGVIPAAVR
ncbi:hypothetical protein GFS60_05782 [Rhodococcus sp. WAY2]|nr:hypothetical protein GFS60_05782 [Rhodococcus sp. WAY2]